MSIRRKPLTRAELDAAVKAHTDWAWNTSKRGQRSAERAEAAREQSQQDQLESDTVKELREEVAGLKLALLLAIERLERVEEHRGV